MTHRFAAFIALGGLGLNALLCAIGGIVVLPFLTLVVHDLGVSFIASQERLPSP
jgi:hypothetical protein